MKNILITGCSSGLGNALVDFYLDNGYTVYGISRTKVKKNIQNFHHKVCDLADTTNIKKSLQQWIEDIGEIETVYLNAGTLGQISSLTKQDLNKDLKPVLELNLWANKELLDILVPLPVQSVVGISSGAAVNGSYGWGAYSLSKASLNMLINLYAKEMPESKLFAIAPGVIKTPMTDIIVHKVDDTIYTSAKRLKNGEIQTPEDAAKRLHKALLKCDKFESGSFIDVRDL